MFYIYYEKVTFTRNTEQVKLQFCIF